MKKFIEISFLSLIFLIGMSAIISSCQKENDFLQNGQLSFSSNLIQFDTVFTTIGSSVQRLTIYNKNDKDIKVSVMLGGNTGAYSFNIDGEIGPSVKDMKIAAFDSVMMFIKVTINPTLQNTPYLVNDSLLFYCGNNLQKVKLLAFGQDAHFIVADRTIGNIPYHIVAHEGETINWTNDKPYVVYGYAVIDSTAKLSIEKGCRIYFHKNAGLWVYKGGCLEVNGDVNAPVTFQGDRLESWYTDDYAQWDRIWINESSMNHVINYAIIQNSFVGIQAEVLSQYTGNTLYLKNTIIKNNQRSGILARGYKIDAENCLITNQGQCGLELTIGDFNFTHTTVANYYSSSRKNPTLYLANNYESNDIKYVGDTKGLFTNCIIYGNINNEIGFSKTDNIALEYSFENTAVKWESSIENNAYFTNCLNNTNPNFSDITKLNFRLTAASSMINKGKTTGISKDLDDKSRDAQPDLGCYEYH